MRGVVFGRMVVAHRVRLGLTQEALAEMAGLTSRSLRELEAGRVKAPRKSTVVSLADAFGLQGTERERFCQEAFPEVSAAGPPAQLPADVAAFTGRGPELAELDAIATGPIRSTRSTRSKGQTGPAEPDVPSRAVVISALAGTAGVGKTALAVHWAHRARDRYPDGQLYVNLRGYDVDQPMPAAEALARFLAALGVPATEIPVDSDERAARYRTALTGRRLLILLDNAGTVEQVRPLLPGTASCAVVVTSRDTLAGLVARHGAHRIEVGLMPADDTRTLLRRLIGAVRVDAEPEAATALERLCAHLPLALRIAAELAVAQPSTPLADLVAELTDHRQRLDRLDAGGDPRSAVRAVFSWSTRHLPADAGIMFRSLGLHPGPDFDVYAAAALAGHDLDRARRALGILTRAHLIHGCGRDRHGMHDLLRVYAAGDGTDASQRAARARLFDYYLATAAAAMRRLHPGEAHRLPEVAPCGTPVPDFADADAARSWLDAERPCLVTTSAYMAANGWPTATVQLSTALFRYLAGGHFSDALTIHGHARDAARRSGDLAGQAQALFALGTMHGRLGRYESAAEHLDEALALFQQAGDEVGMARALGNLGAVEQRRARFAAAAQHHQQAMKLFERADDELGAARALNNLGEIERRLGRPDVAAGHHERALALYRRVGDRTGEAAALTNLAEVKAGLGQHDTAVRLHEEAFAVYRLLGHQSGQAWTLASIGTVHTAAGQPDLATRYHRQALDLFADISERDGQAFALNGLGEAAQATGDPAAALASHGAALATATMIGAPDEQARAHTGLGHAHDALADPARARSHWEEALTLYTDLDMPEAAVIRRQLDALDIHGDPTRAAP